MPLQLTNAPEIGMVNLSQRNVGQSRYVPWRGFDGLPNLRRSKSCASKRGFSYVQSVMGDRKVCRSRKAGPSTCYVSGHPFDGGPRVQSNLRRAS